MTHPRHGNLQPTQTTAPHVLVKCANGHRNWMDKADRDGWRIQAAYCATCGAPLHRPSVDSDPADPIPAFNATEGE